MDMQAASMFIGFEVNQQEFESAFTSKGKAVSLGGGKFFFPDFIDHQYPSGLQATNKAHKNFINTLTKYGLIDSNQQILKKEAPLKDALKASYVQSSNGNGLVMVQEGVQGDWEGYKTKWLGDFRWKEKFCGDKGISMTELQKKMMEFLAELELKDDYKNVPGLKSHFINKYNKQQNGNTAHRQSTATNGKRVTKSTGAENLIASIKNDLNATRESGH